MPKYWQFCGKDTYFYFSELYNNNSVSLCEINQMPTKTCPIKAFITIWLMPQKISGFKSNQLFARTII